MNSDPFARPAPPVRLGAVHGPEAAVLVQAIEAEPHRDTAESLVAMLQSAALEAVLLPPAAAWQVVGVRLVPGIALVRCGAERPEVLLVWACRARAPYAEIRRVLSMAVRDLDAATLPEGMQVRLGGDESDALRALLAEALARGAAPEGQELIYC